MLDEAELRQRLGDEMVRSIDNKLRVLMLWPLAHEWSQREHWHMIPRILSGKVYWYRCPDVEPGDPLATCGVVLTGGTAHYAPPNGAA